MNYSYNRDTKGIIFASVRDLNASFKDLCCVCDAIRYMPVPSAITVLDKVINENRPIEYRRHNKYMGSRHELGGKKGRYPIKCARIVRKVLVNAAANAVNKGENPEYMYVVHASANKTYEVPRSPSKGVGSVVSGGYGYSTRRTSNIDFAKVEIGIADKETKELGARMKRAIKAMAKKEKPVSKETKPSKKTIKQTPKPLPVPTKETLAPKENKTEPVQQPKIEEPIKV
jgi:large subunit ribosomal protein L22